MSLRSQTLESKQDFFIKILDSFFFRKLTELMLNFSILAIFLQAGTLLKGVYAVHLTPITYL